MMQCTVNLSCRAESLNPSGRNPSRKSVILEGLSRIETRYAAIMNAAKQAEKSGHPLGETVCNRTIGGLGNTGGPVRATTAPMLPRPSEDQVLNHPGSASQPAPGNEAAAGGRPGPKFDGARASLAAMVVLGLGLAAIVVPTLVGIAQVSWASEQGSHGPIVLAIAVWLLWRRAPAIWAARDPGSALIGGPVLALSAVAYVLAHVAGSIVIQSAAMFGFLLATCYLFVGWRALRAEWFPFAYFAFVLPPPGSFVAWATQPLRLEISELAVRLFALFGLPVAREGLQIFVAQYVLEVKAACGGLNSMLSLTAISLFYGYIRGRMSWRYGAFFLLVALAFAIVANWVRVCLLVLITYQLGDRAAQGFLHGFSGLTTFCIALLGTMAVDELLERRDVRRSARQHRP